MVTIRGALASAAEQLRQAGIADADREAAWLLAHLLQTGVGSLRLKGAEPLAQSAEFAQMVARRAARQPIQYILGTEEFLGLTFKVTPAVLIPRVDTEPLVYQAAERLRVLGPVRVADIGTGSGAIAIALAHMVPEATVVAVDLSSAALEVAIENAAANRVADRVEFRQGDLVAPLAGERFDAILSNPPYIGEAEVAGLMPEVRDHEPLMALTPGPDGLVIYRRLVGEALPLVKPGGFLGVEVGFTQAAAVRHMFEEAALGVTVYKDSGGIDRAVFGQK